MTVPVVTAGTRGFAEKERAAVDQTEWNIN
jgi:hypothetical protein